MDLILMKTLSKRKFAKDAPVLLRRKRLASNGEVLETHDNPGYVVVGIDIFQCVLNGDKKAVDNYLLSGKNPNIRNRDKNSLLHLAVEAGNVDIVDMFLSDDRCQIDNSNDLGQTPLMCAVTLNDMELVKCLMKAGADIEMRDNTGKTSLLIALQDSNYDIADYLIRHGSDVNVTDTLGHSALFIAINTLDRGCVKIVSKLLKADYSLDKDKEWLKKEGLEIEVNKPQNRIKRVLRKVSCGINSTENKENLLSLFNIRQTSDGDSKLHIMMIER
ncbi:ankyrin repeat, PH and SEC7 domain containing protein secG-like [Saccostrea echinata]|uniref:ankyrin repeat, PH and SEC7 domain containing protein secG-like n=1 Tax=Saccostrea echinata TaxID=191078 RepID=UPI002A821025|nr:ankyrin repeat, PH and SEC7 domain containing protein secG-like [Saccostrea echinata]